MGILERIASEREQRVQDLHLDLPLPTWDGALRVRFNVLEREQTEEFSRKRRTLETDIQFILMSAREIYVYDPKHEVTDATRHDEDDNYVRVEHDNGAPVLFTEEFAAKIGHPELTRPRDILMFSVKNNGNAVGNLAVRLSAWMGNTDARVAEDLLGE